MFRSEDCDFLTHFWVKNRDFFVTEKKFPRTPQAPYRQEIFFCGGLKIGSSGFCNLQKISRFFRLFFRGSFLRFPFPTTRFWGPKNRWKISRIFRKLQNPLRLLWKILPKNFLSMARLGGRGRAFFSSSVFRRDTASRRGGKKNEFWGFFLVPGCIYVIPDIEKWGVKIGGPKLTNLASNNAFLGVWPPRPRGGWKSGFGGSRRGTPRYWACSARLASRRRWNLGNFGHFSGIFRDFSVTTPDFSGLQICTFKL